MKISHIVEDLQYTLNDSPRYAQGVHFKITAFPGGTPRVVDMRVELVEPAGELIGFGYEQTIRAWVQDVAASANDAEYQTYILQFCEQVFERFDASRAIFTNDIEGV